MLTAFMIVMKGARQEREEQQFHANFIGVTLHRHVLESTIVPDTPVPSIFSQPPGLNKFTVPDLKLKFFWGKFHLLRCSFYVFIQITEILVTFSYSSGHTRLDRLMNG